MKYTHVGWLGFCPVKLSEIESNCPHVAPRFWGTTWLLYLCIFIQEQAIAFCSMVDPEWEPTWHILVTRKLS